MKILLTLVLPIVAAVAIGFFIVKNFTDVQLKLKSLESKQEALQQNLPEELFEDHLEIQQKRALEFKVQILENDINNLRSNTKTAEALEIEKVYALYTDFKAKLTRNEGVKLDVKESQAKIDSWGSKLLNKELSTLAKEITDENLVLENAYKKYLATLPPPPTATQGYSYSTVKTEKGTHGVYLVKMPLNSVKVKTVSASDGDCSNNCPTKSLGDYVKENGGVAGINGSYFCPPDYANCSGKTNTFDYAFYDSNDKKWFNKDARSWGDTGMFTFTGNSASFYKRSSDYDGNSVDAAISNYPSLLKDGDIAVDGDILTSFQKVKGTRGALGVGGENIYLAIITNATVEEAAYAMRTLGAKHALNLDGGGSSAMYINGGYVVGPGRSLPNAIVLVK